MQRPKLEFLIHRRVWLSIVAIVLLFGLIIVLIVVHDPKHRCVGERAPDEFSVSLEDYAEGDAALAEAASVTAGNTTLLFSAVVFRHGDRNPSNSYKNDPYADGSVYMGGWSALTLRGKRRMFKLGQRLRQRYSALIPPLYVTEHLEVKSSYADRCLMSAESLLAALYPPLPFERIDPQFAWQPIPVHTVPSNLDRVVIGITADCPRYSEALQCVYSDAESVQINANNSDLMQMLTERSGQEVKNYAQVESLYNVLDLQKQLGLELPQWADEHTLLRMRDLAIKFIEAYTKTPFMRKIRGGPLIEEIRSKIEQRSNGLSEQRLYLVSAHDVSLINLLRAFGFTERPWKPEVSASLLVELHQVGDNRLVKVWYDNGYEPNSYYELLKLPFCEHSCPLSTFLEKTKNLITTTWDWDCTSGPPDPNACVRV